MDILQKGIEMLEEKVEGKMGAIICCFPGLSKSALTYKTPQIVDLENAPFDKDWCRYAKVAQHLKDDGYVVLVSCHLSLREELYKQNIDYTVAMPVPNKKEEYMSRFINSKYTPEVVKAIDEKWDCLLYLLSHEKNTLIVENCVQESLGL